MKFLRRTGKDVKNNDNLKDLFPDWKENETWLFIGPHDDDIVLGSGITMRSAMEAGVDVYALVTTDGGMGYCHMEQEKTIGKIRQKETVDSFKIMGLDDHIGSIEDGKVANLFVCDGDPFETKTQIKHLFISGWHVPLESRHTLLYDEFLERQPGLDK